MIRTVRIPTGVSRLACAPGGNCCSSCARLGDAAADMGDTSSALLVTLTAIIGGFLLAAAAAGKLGKGPDGR